MPTGQPVAAKSKEPSLTLACGKRALMTPLLQLSESQPFWRYEDCMVEETPGGPIFSTVDHDFRVFQVWPLVNKRFGDMHVSCPSPWQSNVTLLKAGAVECFCGAPPPCWQA